MTDKTLDDILERQSTKCKCMAGDTSEMRCMCWTAGHEAGRDEMNKEWTETKRFCNTGKDEKIVALSKIIALSVENKKHFEYWKATAKRNEELETLFNEEGKPSFLKMLREIRQVGEENARLRDVLVKLTSIEGVVALAIKAGFKEIDKELAKKALEGK